MNNQAQPFDYIKEAAVTLSPSWHGDKVSLAIFRVALTEAVEALNNLDAIKKTLFYGKELPESLRVKGGETCEKLPVWFKNDNFGENVIHAIIGAATEAGELLEALRAVAIENKEFDEVNMREEVGDVFWYFAILADTCGFTFEEAQRVNIAKLRMRYGQKFSEFDAKNRNLTAERTILEHGEVFSKQA
jgi:NTP pyrophosphatase (non-canonical NTP hydrolase)